MGNGRSCSSGNYDGPLQTMQPDRCSGGVEIMVLASEHSGASFYSGRRRGRREANVICAPVPVLPDLGTCRSV